MPSNIFSAVHGTAHILPPALYFSDRCVTRYAKCPKVPKMALFHFAPYGVRTIHRGAIKYVQRDGTCRVMLSQSAKNGLALSWVELASFYAQPPETKSAGFAVKFATTLLHMPELLEQVGVVIWCMEWFMAIMTMAGKMRAGERAKRAERVHGMWCGERGHARGQMRAGERAKRAERVHGMWRGLVDFLRFFDLSTWKPNVQLFSVAYEKMEQAMLHLLKKNLWL
uniref:Uncharacterized protein n=1 Tax=Globodera rostochiensis TaxID=31243 RepID=A0A914GU59_GLORO